MRKHTPRLLVLIGSLAAASAVVTTSLVFQAQVASPDEGSGAGPSSESSSMSALGVPSTSESSTSTSSEMTGEPAMNSSSSDTMIAAVPSSASTTSASTASASSSSSSSSVSVPRLTRPPAEWQWPSSFGGGEMNASSMPILPPIEVPPAVVNVPAAVQNILEVQLNWKTPGAQGCFAEDGRWSTDRDACDADQQRHITAVRTMIETESKAPLDIPEAMLETIVATPAPPLTDDENAVLHETLNEWFVGRSAIDGAQQELIAVLQESTSRLDQLKDMETDANALLLIQSTADWLHIMEKLSTEPQTIEQVHGTAQTVRDRLAQLQADLAVVTPPTDVDWIVFRSMDNYIYLLQVQFSRALRVLKDEGVPVDGYILRQQLQGRRLYERLHDACERGAADCRRMTEAAAITANMVENLHILVANAGIDGLEERVEAAADGR